MTEAMSEEHTTVEGTVPQAGLRAVAPTVRLVPPVPPVPPVPDSVHEPSVVDVAVPRTFYSRFGKRSFDLFVASCALVVASPVLAAVALLLRCSLGKGVLFRQARVGRDGQDFEMLKFRTMKADRRRHHPAVAFNGVDRRVAHKRSDDPRHTRVGRVLRRYSIDELPQLINVLRGEMSLVGPRPELAIVVDRVDARSHRRHLVRPGITGEWQVTQRQDGHPLADDFDDDLSYVSHLSLGLDLSIISRTFRVVLAGSGR